MSAGGFKTKLFPALLTASVLWFCFGVMVGPNRNHGCSIAPSNDLPPLPGYRAVWERGPLETLIRPDDVYVEVVQEQPTPFMPLDFRLERQLRRAVERSPLVVVATVDAIEPRRQFPRFVAAVARARVERVLKNVLPHAIADNDALEVLLRAIDERYIGRTRVIRRAHYERVPEVGRTYLWCLLESQDGLGGNAYGFLFELRDNRAIPMFQHASFALPPLRAEHALRIAKAAAGSRGLGIRAGSKEIGRWPQAR